MRKLSLVSTLILAFAFAPACGGDDDDGGDDNIGGLPDAGGGGGGADAGGTGPDAGGGGGGGTLGAMCTPDQANPQGDCATDHICLSLNGGSRPWCSLECAGDADCAAGYTGPGQGMCVFGIDTTGDMMADLTTCGIVCEDLTDNNGICPTCDGTCPAGMACTADLQDGKGTVVARACI